MQSELAAREAALRSAPAPRMKAVRVHEFGGLDAMAYEDAPRPTPGAGQVLVRVLAAGVGPWDALIRSGRSALHQPLPLTLGSDIAGVIEEVGAGVSEWGQGEAVFGVTNGLFTGGYAEYAVAEAAMLARKPQRLSFIEAASVPVVASTAWQMTFDHGQLTSGQRALVLGAAGGVGAFAVQFAKQAGVEVIATAFARDADYVRSLGVEEVIDAYAARFEEAVEGVDAVLDLVGGDTQERSFAVLKPGGILVSVVAPPDQERAARLGVRGVYFIVGVTAAGLARIADKLQSGQIAAHIGEVLPLSEARLAHEMLTGRPHKPGKIVLAIQS